MHCSRQPGYGGTAASLILSWGSNAGSSLSLDYIPKPSLRGNLRERELSGRTYTAVVPSTPIFVFSAIQSTVLSEVRRGRPFLARCKNETPPDLDYKAYISSLEVNNCCCSCDGARKDNQMAALVQQRMRRHQQGAS